MDIIVQQFSSIIISCGSAKVQTNIPVQAWKLYTGGYYQKMFSLAIRLTPEVLILSAGYGLLRVNDMVMPYDIKMTPKLAKYYKSKKLVEFNGGSLLGSVYEKAITGKVTRIIPDGTGGMGLRMAYANNLAKRLPVIATHIPTLPNGANRTLLHINV